MFSFKDKPPDIAKAGVVYQLECLDCHKKYIGKTIRQLQTRIEEHKTHDDSSVKQHINSTNHRIDWDGIKTLTSADSDKKLLLKEMLFINKIKPELNIQKSSNLFSLIIF